MLKTNDQDEITKASVADLRRDKDEDFGSQRVYKKTSPNSVLTLYLGTRDILCRHGNVEPLRGVIYIDPKHVSSHKVFGQLTLTFRYGREDEEVMGLKFCNEAIIALKQIWPATDKKEEMSSLQQALLDRLGKSAYPFTLEVGSLAPPSVQLVPAKRYTGAPIGTSYDVRVYLADQDEDRFNRRSMVRLGVRVIHKITSESKPQPIIESNPNTLSKSLRLRLSPKALKLANKFSTSVDENQHRKLNGGGSMSRIDIEKRSSSTENRQSKLLTKGPEVSVDKPFLWTEGRVSLHAALDKSAYGHGEHIAVTIDVRNDSRKIIRKVRIFAVQHVDVCMFSNGKFKNIVADITENHQIKPSETHQSSYKLLPVKGPTKNWIAVEGSTSYNTATTLANQTKTSESDVNYKIASSAPRGPQTNEERNVFAIYVSYYIKVKLTLSGMGGEVSLKLPFILGHVDDGTSISDDDDTKTESAIKKLPKNIEEECGQDDTDIITQLDSVHSNRNDGNDKDNKNNNNSDKHKKSGGSTDCMNTIFHDITDSENHCDTVQLEEKLRVTQIVDGHGTTVTVEKESMSSIITAQIHHHHTPASPEERADC